MRKPRMRRGSLGIRERYQLRLLALHKRYYASTIDLHSLTQRGFATQTGRADDRGRAEWAITDAGRAALADAGW